MTREQAREEINNRLTVELTKAPKRVSGYDTYICPFCGNGSGKDGTGISTKDGKHYTCFKGCFTSWDYLDILKKQYNIDSEREIFDRYNLTIEGNQPRPSAPPSQSTAQETRQVDYKYFFLEAQESLRNSSEGLTYLKSRGISFQTADCFMLGYDPEWRSPTALKSGKNPPASKRLIIPTGRGSYLARAIEKDIDPAYRMMKEGTADFFNKKALRGVVPLFVTEAAIDALSVIEAGGEALGLGSTSSVNKFLDLCKAEPPTVPLILSLDNDKPGQEAQEKLKKGLEELNIPYIELNISGEYKDPNEALTANRDLFFKAVEDANVKAIQYAQDIENIKQVEKEAEREQYINATSVTAHINDFLDEIKNSVNTPAIPTNFSELDKALDDGLYEGLYILGAISSLGKTSFVLQIADQIAQQKQDVLIFSLEMAKTELMAKSISRITFCECGGNFNNAKTTRGITAGKKHDKYSAEEKALINKSINLYATYTDYLYVYEGMGDIGVAQIRETAEQHMKLTGNKPVIIIDYLQILAPFDIRATDKQNTDKAVFELKRLSRDLKIPVIGISSLNRENYTAKINMAAFKESGAIEYSSDVLIGLQFEAMSEDSAKPTAESIDRLKRKQPRKIELKILKNRNGVTGDSIKFDYYPMFNYFRETGKAVIDDTPSSAKGKATR